MRVMGEGVEVKWQVDTWRVGPAALQVHYFLQFLDTLLFLWNCVT